MKTVLVNPRACPNFYWSSLWKVVFSWDGRRSGTFTFYLKFKSASGSSECSFIGSRKKAAFHGQQFESAHWFWSHVCRAAPFLTGSRRGRMQTPSINRKFSYWGAVGHYLQASTIFLHGVNYLQDLFKFRHFSWSSNQKSQSYKLFANYIFSNNIVCF